MLFIALATDQAHKLIQVLFSIWLTGELDHKEVKGTMERTLKCILLICLFMPSISYSTELERDALFRIERNKNANIVQYDAQVTEDGRLYSEEPVVGYWIRLADKGQVQELSWIQNKFAYGFSAKHHKRENTVTLDMVADLGRDILVRQDREDYRAVGRIDGEDSYIEKIFIYATGKGASTRVSFIELYGKAVINGKDQFERFSP